MQIEENSDRKTIHKSIDMQNEMMQRRNQQSQPRKTIVFNDSNDNLDDKSNQSINIECYDDNEKANDESNDKSNQSINIECYDDNEKANDESSELTENIFKKGHMLRKTILHNDSMQIEENSDRKTIHKSIDMQNEMMQRRNQQSQPRKTIVFNDSNDNLDDKSNQSINIECSDDNEKANDESSK
ncbi:hypothetical protein PVAND_011381 [Polypedilum vanderplanki]|uniref:Uncharacterized protein n=1 Tax=Polypedilum vanderplanki TaxID=319348 RepID=A0A9J6CK85_POLVA|nr:hypothetical protein PVAND_011381 [Polypedilum vanderplanki]